MAGRLLLASLLSIFLVLFAEPEILGQSPVPPGPLLLPPQPAPVSPSDPLTGPPQLPNPGTPSGTALPPVTIGSPQGLPPGPTPVPTGPVVQPPSILQPRDPLVSSPPVTPQPSPPPAVVWPNGVLPPGVELVDGLFFVGLGFEGVKPTASANLSGQVMRRDGTTVEIQSPGQSFNWNVAPTFLVGLRIPNNNGQFTLDYTFLNSSSTGINYGIDGQNNLKTRLSLNVMHLDYTSGALELDIPGLTLKGIFGGRLDSIYYDTTLTKTLVQEKISNYYLGVGPEGGLEIAYTFRELPSLSLYARATGSVIVGQIKQSFSEQSNLTGYEYLNGTNQIKRTESVPIVNSEAGLYYEPSFIQGLKFTLGYQFEQYWWLGKISPNKLDLNLQGAFLRAQFEF